MHRYVVALTAILSLSAFPAFAASPAAEAAAKTISQIETDAAKLQAYCKIIDEMGEAGEDEAKFDELGEQLGDLLRSYGPQYEQALELSETTDPESEDGQALEAAFDKLDDKC